MSTIVGFYAGAESDYRRNQIAASFRGPQAHRPPVRPASARQGRAGPRGLVRRVSTAAAWVLRGSPRHAAPSTHPSYAGPEPPARSPAQHRDHRPAVPVAPLRPTVLVGRLPPDCTTRKEASPCLDHRPVRRRRGGLPPGAHHRLVP